MLLDFKSPDSKIGSKMYIVNLLLLESHMGFKLNFIFFLLLHSFTSLYNFSIPVHEPLCKWSRLIYKSQSEWTNVYIRTFRGRSSWRSLTSSQRIPFTLLRSSWAYSRIM